MSIEDEAIGGSGGMGVGAGIGVDVGVAVGSTVFLGVGVSGVMVGSGADAGDSVGVAAGSGAGAGGVDVSPGVSGASDGTMKSHAARNAKVRMMKINNTDVGRFTLGAPCVCPLSRYGKARRLPPPY